MADPPSKTSKAAPRQRVTLAAAVMAAAAAGALWLWSAQSGGRPAGPPPIAAAWSGVGAQARCDSALALVTHPDRWPTMCRWRDPGESLQGQAFPPPKGPPPYDDPHVEIYVAPGQSREELARAIAHEYGHMHHTREPVFAAQWLAARNLPADTPPEVWTEDYAEVFATLFGPPSERWAAPTPRPSPEAVRALAARFFS